MKQGLFLTDAEVGVLSVAREVFRCNTGLCFFHITKSWLKKLKNLGLTADFKSNKLIYARHLHSFQIQRLSRCFGISSIFLKEKSISFVQKKQIACDGGSRICGKITSEKMSHSRDPGGIAEIG